MGKRIPLAVRLQSHIKPDDNGCWIWTGATDKRTGYGRIQMGPGSLGYSHRVAYELLVGPIKPGMHIDHLCRVRSCCNPDHLEPVTPLINTHRSPISNAAKLECPSGHPYAGDNLRYHVDQGGRRRRVCRTCGIERSQAFYLASKAA